MMSFVEGAADVLLATNIVESGLDIPRANTIVVCWPERFGLAQLHQLRGRVGRSGIRAFACLLTDSDAERSEKRLAVLEEFSRPGAGFAISARDLDLRGAGDLLSERQSGHLQVFGPVLYSHLLKSASEKADGRAADLWGARPKSSGRRHVGRVAAIAPWTSAVVQARRSRLPPSAPTSSLTIPRRLHSNPEPCSGKEIAGCRGQFAEAT